VLEQARVDLKPALDVLGGGMAGSTVLNRRRAAMERRDFKPGFRIDLHHKDMCILMDTARALGVPLPVGSVAAGLIASARAAGDGQLDHSALLRGLERLSGKTPSGEQ
jgi:2-hydroxy-3-oxopropionate reductase